MTRRRAAAFRGRGSNSRMRFGPSDVRARTDWQVGGGYIVPSAPSTVSAVASWGGGTIPLLAASYLAFQAITLPEAATAVNAPPSIGEVQVDEVCGSIFFLNPTVAGTYYLGVGIYVAKYNTTNGAWTLRQPQSSADASEDDWLFLRQLSITLSLNTAVTGPSIVEVPIGIPHAVVLGRGEALHVAVDNGTMPSGGSSAGNINVLAAFRSRISQIS